jgi:hypothetical protein
VSYLKDVLPASLAHGFDADFAELTMAYAYWKVPPFLAIFLLPFFPFS